MTNFLKIIFLAIISAALAIVAEQMVAAAVSFVWQKEVILESYSHFTWFLALSAAIEETSKYWAVYFIIKKNFGLEKIKLVLASLLLGISWGIFEIGLVLLANPKAFSEFQSAKPEIMFSLASLVALHTLTASLMGIFIASHIFLSRLKHLKIIFFPLLIHLLFNFLIIQKGDFTNYLILLSFATVFLAGIIVFSFNFKRLA